MLTFLPSFQNTQILIVGDLMLDKYWYGGSSRISPEAPVQVLNVGQMEERPGGAGNVALNIVSLGGNATVIGVTGKDEEAKHLISKLSAAKVKCDFEQVDELQTITKLRIISRQQQLIRLDFEEKLQGRGIDSIPEKMKQHLPSCGAIIFSDYAKGTLDKIQDLIQIARIQKIPILVDPKGSDFTKYKGATIVTPNLLEFEEVVGKCDTEKQLIERGQALLKSHDWQALLITRGEQGMTLLRPEQPELHLPAVAREVFDVTGAGDTVISTLATSLAAGSSIENAVTYANAAAAVVVGKLGTATVGSHELRRRLRTMGDSSPGTMSKEQLLHIVEESKVLGEKIVMTNGCFDILHAGHVTYLQQAKKMGDRLIVAVNNDESVASLKGEGRPVNSLERRMSVLAALGSVDWVVSFSEDTPKLLICDILPDILVKGGDYKVSEIAGADCVLESGGQVEVLEFIDGVSTTKIIESIHSSKNVS
ncbi:MAG: D-beta-D-heptose 7-phosphate kinase/D-beta-D-heptose 1-phosphate adenosyltransferase [Polaribacter sp.]|jgi:D-beta-D-heptose 7-phosphate kinase/D-beta-D-heptose 1-phosphate adenosyltransferase